MDDGELQAVLVGSTWHCIPVLTSAPSTLVVEFFDDGTALTEYEIGFRQDEEDVIRGIASQTARAPRLGVEWAWALSDSTLAVTWKKLYVDYLPGEPSPYNIGRNLDLTTEIAIALEDIALTVYRDDGTSWTFRRKLVPSAHLFPFDVVPFGNGFPDGWPCEYFAEPESAPTGDPV